MCVLVGGFFPASCDSDMHVIVAGVIAVSVIERLSFEDRINASTKLLLNPSLILFWSFSDPINPQVRVKTLLSCRSLPSSHLQHPFHISCSPCCRSLLLTLIG